MISAANRRKVLLIGDSITQFGYSLEHCGWVAGFADWYQRTADVINRGYSGYNALWVSKIVSKLYPIEPSQLSSSESDSAQYPDIVLATIFLGANDSVAVGENQHLPLTLYVQSIKNIISHLKLMNPSIRIIVITPGCVDSIRWPTRSDAQVSQYAQAAVGIAQEEGVSYLDLWHSEYKLEQSDLWDGLHLGKGGNWKVLQGLKSIVRSEYPDIAPDDNADGIPNMVLHFPHWRELGSVTNEVAADAVLSWEWP